MQLSTFIGVRIVLFFGALLGFDPETFRITAAVIWYVFVFAITLVVVLYFLRHEMKTPLRNEAASIPASIGWAIGGIFISLFAQSAAGMMEQLLGVDPGSENTKQLMQIVEYSPIFIVVISIIGPILEEIIFRKIIFGALYKRFNFFISALISAFIFAAAHMEFVHILLYASMGFTFAFLYVKTKRILVPIFAHVAMNTMVVIVQLNLDKLQKFIEDNGGTVPFIGGFFL